MQYSLCTRDHQRLFMRLLSGCVWRLGNTKSEDLAGDDPPRNIVLRCGSVMDDPQMDRQHNSDLERVFLGNMLLGGSAVCVHRSTLSQASPLGSFHEIKSFRWGNWCSRHWSCNARCRCKREWCFVAGGFIRLWGSLVKPSHFVKKDIRINITLIINSELPLRKYYAVWTHYEKPNVTKVPLICLGLYWSSSLICLWMWQLPICKDENQGWTTNQN